MGGNVLNLIDDINQPTWNPAVISSSLDNQLALNYTDYLAGIALGSVSYAKLISRRFGTIHANIKYLNYGELIEADVNGNELGTFNANDFALSIGYSRNLPWTNVFFGTNLKFINSSIGNFSSSGIAFDFSLLYYTPYKPYSFTLVLRNLGLQLNSFDGLRENLPFRIAFGGSYQLEYVPLKIYGTIDNLQKWNLSVPNPSLEQLDLEGNITQQNINIFNNAIRHLSLGAELFPEGSFNIRLGYNFRRAAELQLQNIRTFAGLSFGFGLQMRKIKFNYAYASMHSAENTSTFSLLIDLNTL